MSVYILSVSVLPPFANPNVLSAAYIRIYYNKCYNCTSDHTHVSYYLANRRRMHTL